MDKILMGAGALLFLIGVLLRFVPWTVTWFGRLPGDIRSEGEHVSLFFPIVSMVVLSLLLTLIANVVGRFWGK
jgi:hypothetical protein